ncbi:hypothetical protein [Frateuria sp. Soil773]|uniref:hypothetical protein n=1 Tax=Frateuria sp. Soil773 TaxID=1736407 RepID=UPI00138EC98F|nr:hypothetical protein [Frateuria sp. Soil773]
MARADGSRTASRRYGRHGAGLPAGALEMRGRVAVHASPLLWRLAGEPSVTAMDLYIGHAAPIYTTYALIDRADKRDAGCVAANGGGFSRVPETIFPGLPYGR